MDKIFQNSVYGNTIQIQVPQLNKYLAEIYGVLLGDGNINSYKKGKKIRTYHIKIAGDLIKDKDYHENFLKILCEKIFHLKVNIILTPKMNERFVVVYSKNLVEFFESIGFPAGNKIKNKVTIPLWIKENNFFLKRCIRGLIDTDGSVFRMSKKDPNLIRIGFKNFNKKLLDDTREAFIKLGFHPSKIICGAYFVLSRQDEINKYLSEIGFSNKKHLDRLNEFIAL